MPNMKLSEQLIEHAEWWLVQHEDRATIYHGKAQKLLKEQHAFYQCETLDQFCYLCLLEAEYQKDIELETEQLKMAMFPTNPNSSY